MAGFTDDDDGEITSINVTPLVDVTLVLLIIFMVTTSVIANPEGVELNKPDAATGKTLPKETPQLVVKCFADGKISLQDDVPLDDAALRARLQEAAADDPATQGIVLCDEKAPAGTMIHIIDVMRQAGIKKYGVATEKPAAQGG